MKQIAFITGATSGIGAATAHRLAQQGFHLILTGRRKERLEEISTFLKKEYEIEILTLNLDVRNRFEVETSVANLPDEWKKIQVLVNNAGLAMGLAPIEAGSIDHWEQMIDTNLKGLLYVSRAVLPMMIETGNGHVVNVGSIAGKEAYANGNVYCATKAAVDSLSKGMRVDLSKYPIRVSAIHPGMVETEFSIVRFEGDAERAKTVYQGFENLLAQDCAEAIWWMISRPAHVNINELTIMPTAQPSATVVHRKNA